MATWARAGGGEGICTDSASNQRPRKPRKWSIGFAPSSPRTCLRAAIPAFTASFGTSRDTTMSPRFEELLRMADEALYRAKESGSGIGQ